MAGDCPDNLDPLKLVREGTSRLNHEIVALDPDQAPVNARGVADNIVFAQAYAQLINYFDETSDAPGGTWEDFFRNDLSAPLALAAVEDVPGYNSTIREWFAYLDDLENQSNGSALRDRLSYLFAAIGTLAQGLETLKGNLPPEVALRGTLQNLISGQLAPRLRDLIGYYKAGSALGFITDALPDPPMQVLRRDLVPFPTIRDALSADWSIGQVAFAPYFDGIAADESIFGAPPVLPVADQAADDFRRINHAATHNLFRGVFDQFLKALTRAGSGAGQALQLSLTAWDKHEPHYALFLAFLQLLEHVRASANTLTQSHLDFYYRQVLGLKEKPAEAGRAHLLVELARQALSKDIDEKVYLKAGKDSAGKDAFFRNIRDTVINRAKVEQRRTVYRHHDAAKATKDEGRVYASPMSDTDNGLAPPLTSPDLSWHPFFNKVYADGELVEIKMPRAEIGFAVASHYLLAAEGTRKFTLDFILEANAAKFSKDLADRIRCFVTTPKGWLEKDATAFESNGKALELVLELSGADPAVVPFSPKVHGAAVSPAYSFDTDLPVLLVTLKQDDDAYIYPLLNDMIVERVIIDVSVTGLKTLSIANDFGPVDPSKPFQPFGSSPVLGSSLVVGSKEVFEKTLRSAALRVGWLIGPTPFGDADMPKVDFDVLEDGTWKAAEIASAPVSSTGFDLKRGLNDAVLDVPDFTANEPYGTTSRQGFMRLKLNLDFGVSEYQDALNDYLSAVQAQDPENPPGTLPLPPSGPTAAGLSLDYDARATLRLDTKKGKAFVNRDGRFFHLGPFGGAEQHPELGEPKVHLLPQFSFTNEGGLKQSEAEFYIGVSGLEPPQNLSLLFEVADGTANPLAPKPKPHIDWSYLRDNRWVEFDKLAVQDETRELLTSGIVTLSVPRDASKDNTLMPAGLHWFRAAVSEHSDAICMLRLVAAQAIEAVFDDRGNASDFSAAPLPAGTISKLERPDAAIKSIAQPFPSFDGRGAEEPHAFYARVSERLRHKDRAIDLWDYEHLILEAFPQIYKARCLNHTRYEPNEAGTGLYRELAPGHVTIVTIPNIQNQKQRDPLKPFTSLGMLEDIKAYLENRTSCFAQLHVKNPQFEEVRTRFAVRLRAGSDEAYSVVQLQQAITRFLSPWAFAEGEAPSFGGKVYKSALVNFVEDQDYVDYVTDFQVFQDVGEVKGTADLDEVAGTRAVSMLVSAAPGKHQISVITPKSSELAAEDCGCPA